MGTRSVIAAHYPDGVKGRYVHWDGYPSGVGKAVFEIAKRDGLEGAFHTLLERHYGWSTVTAKEEHWFKHNHQSRGRGEAALLASMTLSIMQQNGIDSRRASPRQGGPVGERSSRSTTST